MMAHGYIGSKASDLGTAFIAADGSIMKSHAGNHRFSVARILGVPLIPLEILGAHAAWMTAMQIGGSTRKLASAIRQVELMNTEQCDEVPPALGARDISQKDIEENSMSGPAGTTRAGILKFW